MFKRKQLSLGILLASTAWTNHAIAQSAPADYTYATRYDAARRVSGTIAPDPDGAGGSAYAAVRNTYDPAGRLTKIEYGQLDIWQPETVAPAAWSGFTIFARTEISYDALGRKLLEQTAKGSAGTVRWVTQYSYDVAGRLECTAVRMNPAVFGALPGSACTLGAEGTAGPDRITRNFYDAAGRVQTVQKAVGTSVQIDYARYEYSPNGKQKAVIDANSNRAEFAYDAFDRLVKWTFPSKTVAGQVNASDYEEYGYDTNSNRTSLRKRDGRTILYSYDALNRPTSKTYPDGGARPVHYAHDLRGLQTMARFDSLSGQGITNGYDGFGRLSATTAVMSLGATEVIRNLSFIHDANGNRTRITYPDGQYASAAWDGLDRFYFHNMSGGTNLNYATYNSEGRVTTLLRWGAGTWGSSTNFGYNGMSELVSYDHAFQNSAANVATSFSYNSARQIISRTRNNDEYRFNGYTAIDRSYARNGLNQYTAAGSTAFTYDANGNLTSDGTTTYSYDIENRLLTASTGTSLVTLSYDPLGRLAQVSTSAGVTTQFVYDGDALVAEYDGTGAMTKRYVHGPAAGADDPLVEYVGSSVASPRHLMADHQGSIIAIADVSGNRIAVNGYDEFGIPNGFAGAGTPNTGRFQYTGQAWIPELGMYHYKARIYSPTLGRFLQTDPIGYDDQLNLYAYVANDPVNMNDPDGKYGRGTGFTDDEWRRFDQMQQRAASDMERRAGKMEEKAGKLDEKGKEGGDALRKQASALRGGAAALRSDGSDGKKANLISAADYKARGGSENGVARAQLGGTQMWLNRGRADEWSDGSMMGRWVVGHESLHTFGLDDQKGLNREIGYRWGSPAQQKAYDQLRGTPQALINPDHIMDTVY